MTTVGRCATALVTLASISESSGQISPDMQVRGKAIPNEKPSSPARTRDGEDPALYLSLLYKAIYAAICAGRMTHRDGIKLFESARERVHPAGNNQSHTSASQQQAA